MEIITFPLSTNLDCAAYQGATLFARFKRNGACYRYDNVPHATYAALCGAESAGQYLNQFIKPFFKATPLDYDFTVNVKAAPFPVELALV